MRTTIEKIQLAAVAGAALLVLIVAGFLGYAHRRAHRLLSNLPARLGADIQKETSGYTYSQSIKGRTVYTIHAATATERKDGLTGLRDVGITLYGAKNGRADRLYGKNFEYDPKNGIIRAVGEVQLDLQAPPSSRLQGTLQNGSLPGSRSALEGARGADGDPIHVTTSGLVYLQRLGIASTDQPIHFAYSGFTGQAEGATYNADSGTTTLERNVRLSGLHDGRPTVLSASHAEFDRLRHTITLQTAHYVVLGSAESKGTGQAASAGTLVLHLRESGGSVETADAQDNVDLRSNNTSVRAPSGIVRFGPGSHPQTAQLTGGVAFSADQQAGASEAALHGTAGQATALFAENGAVESLHLSTEVQATSTGSRKSGAESLSGQDIVLHLAGPAKEQRWIDQATITGQAHLDSVLPQAGGLPPSAEEVRADTLVAHWVRMGPSTILQDLIGNGATEVRRSAAGLEQRSRGDQLEARFSPETGSSSDPKADLSTVIQSGHVTLDRVQQPAPGSNSPTATHATAGEASYDRSSGHLTLLHQVDLSESGSELHGDRMVLTESSGDAEVTGAVTATYVRPRSEPPTTPHAGNSAAPQPVHAVGVRALLIHDTGSVTFFGTRSGKARLWQGASQVEAPTLVLNQAAETLDAFGGPEDGPLPVQTVLASAPSSRGSSVAKPSADRPPTVLRVRSGHLHYTGESRQAHFTDRVLLDDGSGTLSSRDAVASFAQPASAGSHPVQASSAGPPRPGAARDIASGTSLLSGGLERVVATGEIVIRQPGRIATGEQAVYTTADRSVLLTGTRSTPPKVIDESSGEITGAALRFQSGDNDVVVEGRSDDPSAAITDGRVHTRTRVKQ